MINPDLQAPIRKLSASTLLIRNFPTADRGCFPASIFAVCAFLCLLAETRDHRHDFRRWMKFLVFILFITIALPFIAM